MKYLRKTVVMAEVPEHVSLCFEISECPHRCVGCHSPELQSSDGIELDEKAFKTIINRYSSLFDCVLFFGGDHDEENLIKLLKISKELELKTALWTGSEEVSKDIKDLLDFLKTGPYDAKKGPITSKTTNQKYFNLKTGEEITYAHFLPTSSRF